MDKIKTFRLIFWTGVAALLLTLFLIFTIQRPDRWWQNLVLTGGGYLLIILSSFTAGKLADITRLGKVTKFAARAVVWLFTLFGLTLLVWLVEPSTKIITRIWTGWQFVTLAVISAILYACPRRKQC